MIHFQNTATSQRDAPVLTFEHAIFFQLFINRTKLVPHIDTKLILKVTDVDRASLQLQNHLANQSLFQSQGNGPQERQAILVKDAHIIFEVVRVLEIHAAEVRE